MGPLTGPSWVTHAAGVSERGEDATGWRCRRVAFPVTRARRASNERHLHHLRLHVVFVHRDESEKRNQSRNFF